MEFQKNLLEYISQSLMTTDETISVAESVTSGCLQLAFSQMPNASMFYKGGLTSYTLQEKVRLLGVDAHEAEECDCVSENIAETMALNVAKLFNQTGRSQQRGIVHQYAILRTKFLHSFHFLTKEKLF